MSIYVTYMPEICANMLITLLITRFFRGRGTGAADGPGRISDMDAAGRKTAERGVGG